MSTSTFPNSIDAFPGGDETLPRAALINDAIVAIETALLGGTCPVASAATTVTGPDTYGAAAVVGVGTSYARNDHDHGLPAAPADLPLAGGSMTGAIAMGAHKITGLANGTAATDAAAAGQTPCQGTVAVNALGVKTTTGTLVYGVNTVTGTSSDALVLTLPAAAYGAMVTCIFTNAAGTSATSLAFSGAKVTSGFAAVGVAGAVSVFTLVSDGTNWYGMCSALAES
jgi:hypothetical protein